MVMGLDCTTNLTDTNVVRRLRFGIATLALGLVGAVVLKVSGASPNVRMFLFVPFFVSANSFFQAIYMTCGYSALSGMRHTHNGTERIADRGELRSVRARGLRQIGLSFLFASALTATFLFV
jgi:hypothetical protein